MSVILTTYQGAILGPIARLLGIILETLYKILSHIGIENTGICIIIFTFLVNALMLPMQIKQQKFSKMSAIMNPELMAIQKKYQGKTDQASQQKMSLETQAVYQKYGVSPASGCLPMLITFPILLALYRVIYNIPAYVQPVYDIYEALADKLQAAGATVEQLSKMVSTQTYVINDAVRAAKESDSLTYFIDVLGQFNTTAWGSLADKYPQLQSIISEVTSKANHINSFLGLNIANTPKFLSVSVLIPIISVITQIASMKISMAGAPQSDNDNNPAAASMKMMNNVMPIMSGVMCFMFPIGVGLYWIAGNIFRIFQSLGINIYFSKMDMEAEMAKNVEKNNKKLEKLGIDPNTMKEVANKRTSNINVNRNSNGTMADKVNAANSKNSVNYKRKNGGKYKEGSIAAYANMLSNDDYDK
ncbi:MAG: YidC/Oxa1 family membrane protein insertase [Lachnospiraceae bacterium]|nr:YidC/Oxa1 family membrane protein insertase [Lachnospiraceae bacterium]MCI5588067.1 YidC/Oxa1 family membrane protein insertase [Lachnospiraceae bacterium]